MAASRIIGPSQAVHRAVVQHYYANHPANRSRIIQPAPVVLDNGPILAFLVPRAVAGQSEHTYHPIGKHHDPVAQGSELMVVVVFVLAMGKLFRTLVSEPFEVDP